jgi:DNA-binding beta-propeller fold protein YncE
VGEPVVRILARDSGGGVTPVPGPGGCLSPTGRDGCTAVRGLGATSSIALSADGMHAYVTSDYTGRGTPQSIVALRRDPQTGRLTQLPGALGCSARAVPGCSFARKLSGANRAVVSPDGRSVYVVSEELGDEVAAIAAFRRDAVSGALAQLPGRQGCVRYRRERPETPREGCDLARALNAPVDLAVSPDGRNVYVAADDGVVSFLRDPASGGLRELRGAIACNTHLGSFGCRRARGVISAAAVAVSPDGRHVYVAAGATDGVVSNAVAVFARHPVSGALSQLPGRRGCTFESAPEDQRLRERCARGRGLNGASDLAVSPDGRTVYVVGRDSRALAAFSRAPGDGALVQLAGRHGCVQPQGAQRCRRAHAVGAPTALALAPGGEQVYLTSGPGAFLGSGDVLDVPVTLTIFGMTQGR